MGPAKRDTEPPSSETKVQEGAVTIGKPVLPRGHQRLLVIPQETQKESHCHPILFLKYRLPHESAGRPCTGAMFIFRVLLRFRGVCQSAQRLLI